METRNQAELDIIPPDNLKHEVESHLGANDFLSLGRTNKYLYTLFHSEYQRATASTINDLLSHVVTRRQVEAGAILQLSPHFLLAKGFIGELFLTADNRRREFKKISSLGHALWTWDVPMLYWMLLYSALFYAPEDEKTKMVAWIDGLNQIAQKQKWLTYSLIELKIKMQDMLKFVPHEFIHSVLEEWTMLEISGTEQGFCYQPDELSRSSIEHKQHYEFWSDCHNLHQENYRRLEISWEKIGVLQGQSTFQVIHEYGRLDKKATLLKFDTDFLPREPNLSEGSSFLKKLQRRERLKIYRGESYPAQDDGIAVSTNGEAQEQDGKMIAEMFSVRKAQLQELKLILKDLELSLVQSAVCKPS